LGCTTTTDGKIRIAKIKYHIFSKKGNIKPYYKISTTTKIEVKAVLPLKKIRTKPNQIPYLFLKRRIEVHIISNMFTYPIGSMHTP
jgi:hypothetical protein